jgi:outer membrane receptor protein involved in Fe transport
MKTQSRELSGAIRENGRLRIGLGALGACAIASMTYPVSGRTADLNRPVIFSIPSQSIEGALLAFSNQANVQLTIADNHVGRLRSTELRGNWPAELALSKLLEQTGLTYQKIGDTVMILPLREVSYTRERARTTSTIASSVSDSSPDEGNLSTGAIEEVTVTAQKRSERLQDVPVPVTAIAAAALVESNELRLQDYSSSVPGLNVVSSGHGDANLSIRGITTGSGSNPTVGVTVDDVPFGSSTALAGSRTSAPDLDPSDLQRIEVLRGPQGTLYGASSIGGLLKFVTVDPSTTELTGRLQGDLGAVHNGEGVGYALRAAVNVPINDSVAIRASGFTRRDPGYIDNPVSGVNGVNDIRVSGGHLSASWHLSANWSVKLSALVQTTRADGTSDVSLDPGLGELQQAHPAGTGSYHHDSSVYSAIVTGSVAAVNVTSISAFGVDRYSAVSDLTPIYGYVSEGVYGVTANALLQNNRTNKFSQELRFGSAIGQAADWLFGVFYTHERSPTHDVDVALDSSGASAGFLYDDPYPTTYAEYAAFGDLTVHATDRLDIQIGGRGSQNRQSYEETISGPFDDFNGLPSPAVNPSVHTKDNAFTFLATPSFKFTQDLMVYGRIASGYRPGGPNPTCILFAAPCEYQPDKTINYEIGTKAQTTDHRYSVDASLYYIDWKDIQLQVSNPASGAIYYTNASRAKSQGLELSVQARPIGGLTAAAWIAFNDAKLSADLPPNSAASGFSGDRLPYSSRFSGNLSLEDVVAVSSNVSGFAGGSLSYLSNRRGDFSASADQTRLYLPGYGQMNLHAGVRWNAWTTNVFLNNVADRRGVLFTSRVGATTPVTLIQPRTVGLSLSRTF